MLFVLLICHAASQGTVVMPIHANTLQQLANNDPKLTQVILTKKNLTDDDVAPLLSALWNNSNLEYLDLSHNLLTNKSGHQLENILLRNRKIYHLNISYNFISSRYRDAMDLVLWERKKFEALCGTSQRCRSKTFWQVTPENERANPEQWDDANHSENAIGNTFSFPFKPK